MVLCAGLGTRLRPLTLERPKALVPVLDRPLAAHALGVLAAAGVRRVVANAFHLAGQVEPGLEPWARRHGLSLRVLVEPSLLGTGGGLRAALPHLGTGAFVVFNGDLLASPDLSGALEHHRRTGARVTLVVREDPRAERFGVLEVDRQGRLRRLLGEGEAPREPLRRCLFTGVYVLDPSVAPWLPEEGCVVKHTLRALLARGETVAAWVDQGPWRDLGTLSEYAQACFDLAGEVPRVAAGVEVPAGVALGPGVVLGPGVTVRGRGALSRVVAWDGATVTAPLSDAVCTPERVVPLG